MDLQLVKYSIVKKGLTGEVAVEYNLFSIKKIFVDLNKGIDAVSIIKFEGTPIVSGKLIEEIKEQILDFFQESMSEAPDGIYEVVPEMEYSINKI